MNATNRSARVKLSRASIIAEATDLTGRNGLTLVEALSVLLLEGYADAMTDTTFRIGQWTVVVEVS